MATSGSPWIVTREEIIEKIKKHKGKVTHAAKDFCVAYETLMKKIQADEELIKLVENERNGRHRNMIYEAEDAFSYALKNKETDLNAALKASCFILNSIGELEGWKNTQKSEQTFVFKEIDPTQPDISPS